jgi:hypothetical protein
VHRKNVLKDTKNITQCKNCIKRICCCIDFHQDLSNDTCHSNNHHVAFQSRFSSIIIFLGYAKGIYATALGIEILCIAAAELGENTALYLFGFNSSGIAIAYSLGYALAGFTTFATILGRYNYGSSNQNICSCCSVLENLKAILKTSLVILITAESVCILTAETVDLIFYKYSILLSIPLALLAGAFSVVVPEAYRKTRKARNNSSNNNGLVSFSNFRYKTK